MNPHRAVGLVEGWIQGEEDEVIEAWQYLVDTGHVWILQGHFGRQAVALIEQGVIKGPTKFEPPASL